MVTGCPHSAGCGKPMTDKNKLGECAVSVHVACSSIFYGLTS